MFILFLSIVLLSINLSTAVERCVTVSGRTTCGEDVNPNAPKRISRMELKNVADSFLSKNHEILDGGYTSINGGFELHGCSTDIRDPYIVIYHQCAGHKQKWTSIPLNEFAATEQDSHSYSLGNVSLLNPDFRVFPDNKRSVYTKVIQPECSVAEE